MKMKKVQAHKSPVTNTLPMTKPKHKLATRILGVIFLTMSVSVFAQGIPLMFVFIGAYLGIPTDATVGEMDTMVWLLTSVTMMILAVYAFLAWMKYLWRIFITNPKTLFSFKRKEKHAS
ncbi:hypothetical protein JUJ52_03315 [Virgibacillus sp. AGTR]|uniref:hypothetical protein n=1 Tax=Virgibacillus sp. AGTR TaxID=2812055 RepID=UPI001D15F048|nr:hypothetical protein [Virgibacillus sp. AGTR]MCC2248987.1 hypothetical protein [Virgibacillus sp. AGTR]